jgi:hypothetical protein
MKSKRKAGSYIESELGEVEPVRSWEGLMGASRPVRWRRRWRLSLFENVDASYSQRLGPVVGLVLASTGFDLTLDATRELHAALGQLLKTAKKLESKKATEQSREKG